MLKKKKGKGERGKKKRGGRQVVFLNKDSGNLLEYLFLQNYALSSKFQIQSNLNFLCCLKCNKQFTAISFFLLALLFGGDINPAHPKHIGSIDPNCDVAEVVKGKMKLILLLIKKLHNLEYA